MAGGYDFLSETEVLLVAMDVVGFSRNLKNQNALKRERSNLFRAVEEATLFGRAKNERALFSEFLGDELRLAFPTQVANQRTAIRFLQDVNKWLADLPSTELTRVRSFMLRGSVRAREFHGCRYLSGKLALNMKSYMQIGIQGGQIATVAEVNGWDERETSLGKVWLSRVSEQPPSQEPVFSEAPASGINHFVVTLAHQTESLADDRECSEVEKSLLQCIDDSIDTTHRPIVSVSLPKVHIAFPSDILDPAQEFLQAVAQHSAAFPKLRLAAALTKGDLNIVDRNWLSLNFEGTAAIEGARIADRLDAGELAAHPELATAFDHSLPWKNSVVAGKRRESFEVQTTEYFKRSQTSASLDAIIRKLGERVARTFESGVNYILEIRCNSIWHRDGTGWHDSRDETNAGTFASCDGLRLLMRITKSAPKLYEACSKLIWPVYGNHLCLKFDKTIPPKDTLTRERVTHIVLKLAKFLQASSACFERLDAPHKKIAKRLAGNTFKTLLSGERNGEWQCLINEQSHSSDNRASTAEALIAINMGINAGLVAREHRDQVLARGIRFLIALAKGADRSHALIAHWALSELEIAQLGQEFTAAFAGALDETPPIGDRHYGRGLRPVFYDMNPELLRARAAMNYQLLDHLNERYLETVLPTVERICHQIESQSYYSSDPNVTAESFKFWEHSEAMETLWKFAQIVQRRDQSAT